MFSIISLAVISQTYNLKISGTVTDEVTGEPIIQHALNIFIPGDTMTRDFFYYARVFTGGNGYFEDNIQVPVGEAGIVFVETNSCDDYVSMSSDYSENSNDLVFDFSICSDTMAGECQAWFDYHSEGGPLSIVFTDLSFGNPDSWLWDFGDGGTSTEQYPIHEYGEEGEYYVSLEINTADGSCSSVYEMPIWVGNDTIWYDDCMAAYFYRQDSLNDMTVTFMDLSYGFNNLMPDTWYWEFGDGTTSEEQNPSHTFGAYGEYDVCLTIATSNPATGETCSDTYCSMVLIEDWDNYCEAWFNYMPQGNGDIGLTIQFLDESWGYPTSWTWDFGDGFTSDEQNPLHEYAEEGIYDVCLSIFSDSCESTYCSEVYVFDNNWDECFTWFEYEITDLTVDFTAFYQGTDSSSNTASYSWEFGDGIVGTGEFVQHTYPEDGIYEVMLTAVADDGSCTTTYYDVVWAGDDFSFPVEGYVYLENQVMADYADVYLMTFDTLGNDLVNIATVQIDENGYYEFEEVGLEHCIYFVQAELTSASAYFGDYIPTYHISAMNWEEAWPVFPFPTGEGTDIFMIADGNAANGSGIIDGVVIAEDGRGIMSDIQILLLDENNLPLTYLRTNENGEFQFPELEYGTYIVYTEIVGIETIPAVITITPDSPDVDITIIVRNGEAVLGVDNISAFIEEVGEISPNPVLENAVIEISLKDDSDVSIQVINQFGQVLETNTNHLNAGTSKVSLQTSSLSQGVYIVNIIAEDGVNTVRKFVKVR